MNEIGVLEQIVGDRNLAEFIILVTAAVAVNVEGPIRRAVARKIRRHQAPKHQLRHRVPRPHRIDLDD